MKRRTLILLICAKYTIASYGMNGPLSIIKLQPHQDIFNLESLPEISFQNVFDVTKFIAQVPLKNAAQEIKNDVVSVIQWTTPYVFAYVMACWIDPKPHN